MKKVIKRVMVSSIALSMTGLISCPAYANDSQVKRSIDKIYDQYTDVDRHVDVHVNDGYVTLKGEVENSEVRKRAEELVEDVAGVQGVNNRITVEYDSELKDKVQARLFISPKLDSEMIKVTVDDGKVTLDGHVDDLEAKKLATEKAYKAGARDVNNRLAIVHD